MTIAPSHLFCCHLLKVIASPKRVGSASEKISREIDMQRITRLHMTIAFDVNRMLQERHAIAFFVDIDTLIQKVPKGGKVAHLDRDMRRCHILDHNNTPSTTGDI